MAGLLDKYQIAPGVAWYRVREDFMSILCVACGGSLLMPGDDSALGYAAKMLQSGEFQQFMGAADPVVRVVVLNAAQSTAKCRERGEQFPDVVQDRRLLREVKPLETPWTICDLEDFVMGKQASQPHLEPCRLRHGRGLYGKPQDDLHFREDIEVEAGRELILAGQRSCVGIKDGEICLLIGAGWNCTGKSTWRKIEMIALRELCLADGKRLSVFRALIQSLVRRSLDRRRMLAEAQAEPGSMNKIFGRPEQLSRGQLLVCKTNEVLPQMAATDIVRAWYGEATLWWSSKTGVDVTQTVKFMVEADAEVKSCSDVFGDPAPGLEKWLVVATNKRVQATPASQRCGSQRCRRQCQTSAAARHGFRRDLRGPSSAIQWWGY
eukprot:TRINITY_DN42670_c0_g1_i3.p1 TRINITY_DN42670_c0_g1~~TRINITY_DN42670_c0_g1_i3.p1  ORF type:complete len:426 (+),score=58.91 TRINITY_DN42670_c0_g1_i3:143-1279(+)